MEKKDIRKSQPAEPVPADKKKTFRAGDTVIYGAYGVCEVSEVLEQSFHGETREYYVLRSVYCTGDTVFVPTDSTVLTDRMFPALTREEIDVLLAERPAKIPAWIESDEDRKRQFGEILTSGDRKALLGMVRSLYAHREKQEKRGRKLHIADEKCFRDGEKLLCEEFAHVLHITPDQAADYIRDKLQT